MNLIGVLRELQNQARELKGKYNQDKEKLEKTYNEKLKELQIAYDVNSKMNSVCVYCEGEGSVKVYHGYYEDRGTCERCGSGVEPKKEG